VFGVELVLVKPLLVTFCHFEASEIISSISYEARVFACLFMIFFLGIFQFKSRSSIYVTKFSYTTIFYSFYDCSQYRQTRYFVNNMKYNILVQSISCNIMSIYKCLSYSNSSSTFIARSSILNL
jgi:hypothetical protein